LKYTEDLNIEIIFVYRESLQLWHVLQYGRNRISQRCTLQILDVTTNLQGRDGLVGVKGG
jgi:hypothetical protein